MIWLILLCIALLITVFFLIGKIIMMKKSAKEIRLSFAEKLKNDTNTLISISSCDKSMCALASDINVQLAELRRQRHRFVQGDTELKNAVMNISHDLRTPLTAISGYLELMDKEEKSDKADKYIEIIKNRTELLSGLTEELFRYSVILSPEYSFDAEPLIVNIVLEESILGFYAALRRRGITPALHITEHRIKRKLSRAALSRIFSNLLNNALKYSDGDLEIELAENGKITFSNYASELNEVQAERLFDRFYTVNSARKSTGLGLSIARVLTEQMNGKIYSEYKNNRFSVYILFPENAEENI